MPRGRAHGVVVAVVVGDVEPVTVVALVAVLLAVPPDVLVAPAALAEDVPVLAVVGGGGAAGAGVTLGVATGTDRETYGSSTTLAGCTMPWFVAAATMRGGVSSSETASSAWRCVLCSSDSSFCNEVSRTCPFARSACATTTANSDVTTIDTETILSTRLRFANSPAMRPPPR